MSETKVTAVDQTFPVKKTTASRLQSVNFSDLRFGDVFSDHMFELIYENNSWQKGKIIPYGPVNIMPSANILHYGQGAFEGMKAFTMENGEINVFRIHDHYNRFNDSCKRLNIPSIPEETFTQAILQLVDLDREWVPSDKYKSLYLRPFVFATEEFLGLKTSTTYRFYIITGPVGNYYREGINPVKLTTMPDYVRAVKGGVGNAKVPGNYAASLYPAHVAMQQGYSQVLWLDAIERKYVEEVGAMNIFFVIDGKVSTSPLTGTILPGVTRRSVLELCKLWGLPAEERMISIDELFAAYREGRLTEAFGSGTAAVISPVGVIHHKGEVITLDTEKMGPVAERLYATITGIHHGTEEDPAGWCNII
ncbi:branched-chain amino acid aminotransferase [Cyclonatronum proteinivorum]|uniref:Branched-chain-amino-acid aminotransferase n=1 Tax=Cyclonatronum proteinivorum TaxID=1457365 RepID=A0A345UM40_9BACT|nr:branched-chain amino acid aminotransferase [Cyclonatronum proteinivorum]AXJ01542.1 branched-chain amino acid aminotransferase [Cyclonatronum proteinivorum]